MPALPSKSKPEPKSVILSAGKRKELRAAAHALQPIVHVGHGGVHEPIIAAVERALSDHELIKVRLHEPEDKQAMAEQLASQTGSTLCGLVGHTVILYRPKPEPKPAPASRDAARDRRAPRKVGGAARAPRKAGGAARGPRKSGGAARTSRDSARSKTPTRRRRVTSR
jgi:RNA-binding protein